jgi:hypothetical protein
VDQGLRGPGLGTEGQNYQGGNLGKPVRDRLQINSVDSGVAGAAGDCPTIYIKDYETETVPLIDRLIKE